MKKYLFAVSMVALVATSAHAADVVSYEAPASYEAPVVSVPDFSWAGGYIGAQIGGTWAETDVAGSYRDNLTPANNGSLLRQAPDPDGFSGGLYLGYNFAVDAASGFIMGVETDFSWGSIDETSPYGRHNLTPYGFAGSDMVARSYVEQEWAGATRIRAGIAMDRWLPYIAAGVAYAKVKTSVNGWIENGGIAVSSSEFSHNGSDTLTGWTVGAGSDYAVTDNLLLRLEYRYSDYGDSSYTVTETGTDFVSYKVDHKAHDLRVGVAYKF